MRTAARVLFLVIAWLPVGWLVIGGGGALVGSGPTIHWGRLVERTFETLIVAGGTALAALILGGLIAIATGRLRIPGRRIWLLLAVVPLFLPPYVNSIAAVRMLGAQGWITRLVVPGAASLPLGQSAPPPEFAPPTPAMSPSEPSGAAARPPLPPQPPLLSAPIYSRPGVIGVLVFSFLPLVILGGWALLGLSDPAIEEWALLHASAGRVMRRVMLPRAAPGILAGAGCVFLFALAEFGIPEALRTYPVLSVEVYTQMGVFYSPRAGALAGLALVLLALVAAALVGFGIRALRPDWSDEAVASLELPGLAERTLLNPGRWQRQVWTVALFALVFVPVAAVLGTLIYSSLDTEGWHSWATAWQTGRDELEMSALLGVAAAGLCLLLGRGMAGPVGGVAGRDRMENPSRSKQVGRFVLGVALFLPLALPAPVVATGWSQLLSALSGWGSGANASLAARLIAGTARALLDGPWALLLAWVGRWTPLAFALLELGLRQTPREWVEAARLEGAGPLERLRILEWPVLRRPALAALALVFCLSLGEVGAAILLLPPGTTSLGVRLMTLMHYAPTATVSALALSSVVLGLAAGAVVLVVSRTGKKATSDL